MISVNISDIQKIEVMDARDQITLVIMYTYIQQVHPVMLLCNLIVLQWWIQRKEPVPLTLGKKRRNYVIITFLR